MPRAINFLAEEAEVFILPFVGKEKNVLFVALLSAENVQRYGKEKEMISKAKEYEISWW